MYFIIFCSITLGMTGALVTERASNDLARNIEQAIEEDSGRTRPMPEGADNAITPVPDTGELVAEPQIPTGKFTTATEVRPILEMTRAQWVAVRDYDGKDLLYFTNLLAWRCGLLAVSYSINGGPEEALMMEPCYDDEATPNALKMESILPYLEFPAGSIETVTVTATFDDLSVESVTIAREEVLMP